MPKTCQICGGKHYAKGFCAVHYTMPSQLNPKPIKRTEIKKSVTISTMLRKPIKKESTKRAKENREYNKLALSFKLDNPFCHAGLSGCTTMTTEVHHTKGRTGSLLTNVMYFLAVCRNCHDWIENNPAAAKEKGLSTSRLVL